MYVYGEGEPPLPFHDLRDLALVIIEQVNFPAVPQDFSLFYLPRVGTLSGI